MQFVAPLLPIQTTDLGYKSQIPAMRLITDKQYDYILDLGGTPRSDMTREEASELIDELLLQRDLEDGDEDALLYTEHGNRKRITYAVSESEPIATKSGCGEVIASGAKKGCFLFLAVLILLFIVATCSH